MYVFLVFSSPLLSSQIHEVPYSHRSTVMMYYEVRGFLPCIILRSMCLAESWCRNSDEERGQKERS